MSSDPAEKITVKLRKSRRTEPPGFSEEQARTILLASRTQPPEIRWSHWLAAFGGERIAEIADANAADFRWVDGTLIFSISEEHRDPGATVKTETSVREVPIATAVIAEGFADYLASLPPGSPLFPGVKKDQDGKRASRVATANSKWVRHELKITGGKPHHGWRHRLVTLLRDLGVRSDVSYALSGHGEAPGHEGMSYGAWLRAKTAAIERLPHPLAG
jgi:integrase